MNKFRQHVPAMVSGVDPIIFEFETQEELLSSDIVSRYAKSNNHNHFAMDDNCLLTVSEDGTFWWTIGMLEHTDNIDLPKWSGPKYRDE